jgi:hypothetical protein
MQLLLGLVMWVVVVVGTWLMCDGIFWVLKHLGMSDATSILGTVILVMVILVCLGRYGK